MILPVSLKGRRLSTLIDLMEDGKTYVNAHTVQNPDGEIRGQIKPVYSEYQSDNQPRLFYERMYHLQSVSDCK